MLKQDYQIWMDRVKPDQDFQARLTEAMASEQLKAPRHTFRVLMAAAVMCGMLVVSALALSSDLRQTLSGILGGYTPYSQTVEGISVTDQGVKVEVVAALTDAAGGTAYLQVTDLEGDRIGPNTTLTGGEEPLAYDSESGTALYAWELDRGGGFGRTVRWRCRCPSSGRARCGRAALNCHGRNLPPLRRWLPPL